MSLEKSLKAIAILCLLATVAEGEAFAQGEIRRQTFGELSGFDLNPLQQMTRFPGMTETVPLEGAVDAEAYIIGPGDLFDVSIGGAQPILVTLPVSADGYLLLPGAGAVDIAGRTLADARQVATASLREEFSNVKVEVTLSQPRQFYVHVSGAVPTPGRFVATPVARVATVLNVAYSDTTRAPVSNRRLRPSLRNVTLVHPDGTSESIDLLRYYATGDTRHNPYLRDGDVISVPTYDPDYDAVFISGNVAFPGTYDHRPDDTIGDLLALATGHGAPYSFEQVRVMRTGPDGEGRAEIFDVADLDGTIPVGPLDQVHAVRPRTVRGEATIDGWVEYPGTYSIIAGETTLQDLVEMAGGLRPDALERGAYLQRASLPLPEMDTPSQNRFEQMPGRVRLIRSDTLAILKNTRLARLNYLSSAYLAHEFRLQNRVPIDLNAALHGETEPIFLQDGDRVHVPRDEKSVFVIGQVNRPGYVNFAPDKNFSDYIAESGGLGINAGDAYVIEAGTGRYLDPRRADIQSGDVIFVDRNVMRADSPELQRLLTDTRRIDLEERSRLVQSIVQTVGAAAAVVTAYVALRRVR